MQYGRVRCFLIVEVNGVGKTDIYRRADGTGEEFSLRAAPIGAMWDAHWYREVCDADGSKIKTFSFWEPVDGMNLVVRLPNGGDWYVDGRANNCTDPNRPHRCWVRHGVVPDITIDKQGDTCSAGAGSILQGDYHGFLRGGWLEDC